MKREIYLSHVSEEDGVIIFSGRVLIPQLKDKLTQEELRDYNLFVGQASRLHPGVGLLEQIIDSSEVEEKKDEKKPIDKQNTA